MFTRLHTNLKAYDSPVNGIVFDHLQQATAIVGEWRVGKTRILRAVEFAHTGELPGGGRPKEIFEAWAPPGATELFAYLTRADGQIYSARIFKSEAGSYELVHNLPADVRALPEAVRARCMPLASAQQTITKGDDLGRRELVLRFGGDDASVAPPKELSKEDAAVWTKMAAEAVVAIKSDKKRAVSGEPDAAEVLVRLVSVLTAGMTAKRKAINQLTESTKDAIPDAAGAEQLPDLKRRHALASAYETAASVRESLATARASLDAARASQQKILADKAEWLAGSEGRDAYFAGLADKVETAKAAVAEAAARLAAEEENLADVRGLSRAASVAVNEARAAGKAVAHDTTHACPLCANLTWIVQLQEMLSREVEKRAVGKRTAETELNAAHEAHQAAVNLHASEVKRAEDYARGLEDWTATVARTAAGFEAQIAGFEKNLVEMKAPETYEGLTAAQLASQIDALTKAVVAREQYEAKLKEIQKGEDEHRLITRLKKVALGALTSLVDVCAERAEAAVAVIAPSLKARFNRETYVWEVYSIRDGRWHDRHTACGDELTSLVLSVAVAYTTGAPNRLLMLDDAEMGSMDPSTLARLVAGSEAQRAALGALPPAAHAAAMAALNDVQVLIAWTRPNEIPFGIDRRGPQGQILTGAWRRPAEPAIPSLQEPPGVPVLAFGEAPGQEERHFGRPPAADAAETPAETPAAESPALQAPAAEVPGSSAPPPSPWVFLPPGNGALASTPDVPLAASAAPAAPASPAAATPVAPAAASLGAVLGVPVPAPVGFPGMVVAAALPAAAAPAAAAPPATAAPAAAAAPPAGGPPPLPIFKF